MYPLKAYVGAANFIAYDASNAERIAGRTGFSQSMNERLILTNWIRTAAFTLHGILVLWMVASVMLAACDRAELKSMHARAQTPTELHIPQNPTGLPRQGQHVALAIILREDQ